MQLFKSTFYYSVALALFVINVCMAQSEYTFTLGSKTITPEANLKQFFNSKADYKDNLYEKEYFVVVQFYKAPTKTQINTIRRHITLIHEVNSNTYIASFSSKISKKRLKKLKVRAVVALSKEMKLEKDLTKVFEKEEQTKVNIVVSKAINKEFVTNQLKELNVPYVMEMFRELNNKHMVKANIKQLEALAKLPWIVQIEAGGMR